MKKVAVRLSKEDRIKFLRRNFKLANEAFRVEHGDSSVIAFRTWVVIKNQEAYRTIMEKFKKEFGYSKFSNYSDLSLMYYFKEV